MTFTKDSYTKEELCKLLNLDKRKNAQDIYFLTEYQKQVGSMKGKTWDEIATWGMEQFSLIS